MTQQQQMAMMMRQHEGDELTGLAQVLQSPMLSEPKIIVNSMTGETSADQANKTSDDFYSKISSID